MNEHLNRQHTVSPAHVFTSIVLNALASVALEGAEIAVDEAKGAVRRGKLLTELAGHLRTGAQQFASAAHATMPGAAHVGAIPTEPNGACPACGDHCELDPDLEREFLRSMGGDAPPHADNVPGPRPEVRGDGEAVAVLGRAWLNARAAAARKGNWTRLAALLHPSERAELASALA
jgi:hypothetical protein